LTLNAFGYTTYYHDQLSSHGSSIKLSSAADKLGRIGDPSAIEGIANLLNHKKSEVSTVAFRALCRIGTDNALHLVLLLLYHAALNHDIRNVVDVMDGRAKLEKRPGYAHGEFRVDVSSYLMAFLYGRESESCGVKTYNDLMKRKVSDYIGTCLLIDKATPFEVWTASMCDYIQTYELQRHEHSHPVSVVTWPSLDPLVHPSEANYEDELAYQGIRITQKRCFENEDMEIFDTSKIQSIKGTGCFTSYHIYPNYPDFMINDFLEDDSPHEAYVRRLKLHYGNQPVLVAEFGMSSSRNADKPAWWSSGAKHMICTIFSFSSARKFHLKPLRPTCCAFKKDICKNLEAQRKCLPGHMVYIII